MSQDQQSTPNKVVDINRLVLTGRLATDPERKETGSGKPMATFRLANNSSRKAETGFYNVTCFDNTAENVLKYLSAGRRVAIDGKIRHRTWQDQEKGGKREAVDITAHDVQFLDRKSNDDAPGESDAGETPVESVEPGNDVGANAEGEPVAF